MNKVTFRMSSAGKAKRGSLEWRENICTGQKRFWDSLSPEERKAHIKNATRNNKGYIWTGEQKLALSTRNRGVGNPQFGKRHSVKTRLQMSTSQKASCFTSPANFANLTLEKLTSILKQAKEAQRLKGVSRETRDKLSKAFSGSHNPFFGKHHTEEKKKRASEAIRAAVKAGRKIGFASMSKEKLQEINRKTIAKSCARPNKAEAKLMELINEACPNKYKYTGDASVKVAGLYPDFFNVNGRKKVIELFGNYYHSEQVIQGKDWRATELGRTVTYNSYGFDCLIIWEKELEIKSRQELISTIKRFNRSRKCKSVSLSA